VGMDGDVAGDAEVEGGTERVPCGFHYSEREWMETYYVDVGVRPLWNTSCSLLAFCASSGRVQSFPRVGSHGVSGFALRSRTIYPRLAFGLAVHHGGTYVLICFV